MTDEAKTAEPEVKTPAPAGNSGKNRLLAIGGVIAGGLLLGGASGIFVAGPMIASMSHTAGSAGPAVAESHDGKPAPSDVSTVYLVDNLVMNPAGSGGTRFLLVTVGLQMKAASATEELKGRDTEVRDAILRILGGKSVEDLTNVTNRETYKREIMTALDVVLDGKKTAAVYFPQFVIQ